MYKTIRLIQILFFSGFILIFTPPNVLLAAYQLNVSGNRLSADFQDTPLTAIISDIGAKTGIEFLFLSGAAAAGYARPFSFKFEAIPIRAALEKLLQGFNYSLISDGSDTIRQVFILGSKAAEGSGAKTQPPFVMASNAGIENRGEPVVNSSGEGMEISSGEGMVIGQGEGMKVGPPSEKGMEIGPGEGMKIGPPSSEGMNIGPPSAEGMVESPPSSEGMTIASASTGVMVTNNPGTQMNPGASARRPGRWSFRKK